MPSLADLDAPTRALVRAAAAIAVADEPTMRDAVRVATADTPPPWLEEVILQSYLFCGFPRTLNAAREWRRAGGTPAAESRPDYSAHPAWRADGERTCAVVYGPFYERLRHNIADLHPALDDWMIVEGYGKILARPGLDLARRELCVVAACTVSAQERQLHSHLHGARHAGAGEAAVTATIDAVADLAPAAVLHSARMLWARVRGK